MGSFSSWSLKLVFFVQTTANIKRNDWEEIGMGRGFTWWCEVRELMEIKPRWKGKRKIRRVVEIPVFPGTGTWYDRLKETYHTRFPGMIGFLSLMEHRVKQRNLYTRFHCVNTIKPLSFSCGNLILVDCEHCKRSKVLISLKVFSLWSVYIWVCMFDYCSWDVWPVKMKTNQSTASTSCKDQVLLVTHIASFLSLHSQVPVCRWSCTLVAWSSMLSSKDNILGHDYCRISFIKFHIL